MKMKYLITLVFCFISLFCTKAQESKELNTAIYKTITALNNQDEKTLNAMILKDFGIAILFRRGVSNNLVIEEKISIKNPIPEYLPYSFLGEINTKQKVKYESVPSYDCDTEKFTKKDGIYCDIASNYNDISRIAMDENEFLYAVWTYEQISKMKTIEKNSRKIVAFGPNGTHIFYLTFFKNNWYLTMLDRFEVCSA